MFERVKEEDVEKPRKEEAPSNMAIIGVYLFDGKIFECIRKTKPGVGNEIHITDAINLLLEEEDVYACEYSGKRYDIGEPYLWLTANIEFALKRDELREDLIKFIKNLNL